MTLQDSNEDTKREPARLVSCAALLWASGLGCFQRRRWMWVVEGARGFEATPSAAMARADVELAIRGFVVPGPVKYATAWNTCPTCRQLVDANEVFDGSEVFCHGCETFFVCTSFVDGSWALVRRDDEEDEDDDEAPATMGGVS